MEPATSGELRGAVLLRAFVESHEGCRVHGFDLDKCNMFVSSLVRMPNGETVRERETIPATRAAVSRWLGY